MTEGLDNASRAMALLAGVIDDVINGRELGPKINGFVLIAYPAAKPDMANLSVGGGGSIADAIAAMKSAIAELEAMAAPGTGRKH
jgi:hypothetical protein